MFFSFGQQILMCVHGVSGNYKRPIESIQAENYVQRVTLERATQKNMDVCEYAQTFGHN